MTFSEFFHAHPIIGTLGLLTAIGYGALIGLFFAGITLALFNSWRQRKRSPAPSVPLRETGFYESEVNMKGRLALVAGLAIAFIAIGFTPGCMTGGDSDVVNIGDGKLFGQEVDVELVYTSNLGHSYTVASEDGKWFISATGEFYEVSEDGFVITAPDGHGGTFTTRIRRKESPDSIADDPAPDL